MLTPPCPRDEINRAIIVQQRLHHRHHQVHTYSEVKSEGDDEHVVNEGRKRIVTYVSSPLPRYCTCCALVGARRDMVSSP
jgi:hypothetical protein